MSELILLVILFVISPTAFGVLVGGYFTFIGGCYLIGGIRDWLF